ncbi:MAG: hypothetical protein ACREIC_00585 [Limisphaerales bacterium]
MCTLAASGDLVHLVRTPQGGLQPLVAVDLLGNVHLVYLKGDPKACDVMYAERRAVETTFSTPIQVNTEPGCAVALGTVRGAQLALGRNGLVHVVWNGAQPARDPGAKGAPMLYARLDKAGRRLEPQRNLMTSTMNLDGGGSVAADSDGNVYVVWHAHAREGPDDEEHRAVYVARSTDDGRTFAPERKVTTSQIGVCGCCGLKSFANQQGNLAILYRSADGAGNRDSMLLVSRDRGASFESVLLGKWHSSTCPMSTPALGLGPHDGLLAMWETEGQVFSRTFSPRRLAPSPPASTPDENPGDRKHPVFALSRTKAPRLLMAWVEGTGWAKGGSLAWECVDLKSNARTRGSQLGVPAWDFAAAFPEPDGTFTIVY